MLSNTIWSLEEDSEGNIWIGSNGGVTRYNGTSFTHFTVREGLGNNIVFDIMEDKHGRLWFGTGGGVSIYDGKSFRYIGLSEGLCGPTVWSLLEDKQGDIWMGTNRGISRFTGESFINYTKSEGLSNPNVISILEDSEGNLWLGTFGGGVNRFDGKTFIHITQEQGLSHNTVFDMVEDEGGNIWFATFGGGISTLNLNLFRHYTNNQGIKINSVHSILEDSKGNFWFGTFLEGLNRFDGHSFWNYSEPEGLGDNSVKSMIEDHRGRIWLGTSNGLRCYNDKSIKYYTSREGFSDKNIWCIKEDTKGNMWIGTYEDGLYMFNEDSIIHYTENDGLSHNTVSSIIEDENGDIWLGIYRGGFCRYNGKEFIYFTEKEGLSSNIVTSLFQDSRGDIWIGTFDEGICRFDGKRFFCYGTSQGLSSSSASSIMEDVNGNIWVSGKGISQLVFDNAGGDGRQGKPTIHVYRKQDGLKGLEMMDNSVLLDSKNRMWWGGMSSLLMLDMNNYKISEKPPFIKLDWIEINGINVEFRQDDESTGTGVKFGDVVRFRNYPTNLSLPYRSRHLTFHLSAIDWYAPHKIKYSYRIEGLDESWSIPSAENKADYRNLPYGTLTFSVCAIGAAQKWSEPFEYTFTIKPPWYHSWLARMGYILTGMILVMAFVRWRTARLKQRQKELEATVKERTQEVLQQKEEIEAHRDEIEKQRDLVTEQKTEITDSINYAQKIQTAVLPGEELLNNLLPEHFVLFKPKDIVSGDFYWIRQVKNFVVVVAADCTGHGVPGAFMSMLGTSMLNELVSKSRFDSAGEILNRLRKKIKDTLKQEGKELEQKDGMDMSLAVFDHDSNELQYSGAYNPLIIIREKDQPEDEELSVFYSRETDQYQLFEVKGDRQPIAIYSNETDFTTHRLKIRKKDSFYMFSDGYPDQMGGPKGKKFMIKKFKELLLEIQDEAMQKQKEILDTYLEEWKKDVHQIDDILVFGIRW